MVHQNNYNNDDFTMEFGIKMKYELTSVEPRVLAAPKVVLDEVFRFCGDLIAIFNSAGMVRSLSLSNLLIVFVHYHMLHMTFMRGFYGMIKRIRESEVVIVSQCLLLHVYGADVTYPSPGEDDSSPSISKHVTKFPEVTKYGGLFSGQQHRQEMIQDLFTVIKDTNKGTLYGGMIR
ncbi:unnamed protein product [Musa acuminata var. zebrina]